MESALTTERSDSAIQIEKPSVTFVIDSNRKTITRPLRESLGNYNINEINDIYTTTDLLNRLKQKKIPTADMTIIMMGTNDIRNGLSATANKNMGEMAELLTNKLNTTIMAHIPPLDIGTQGTEQHEDMQVDRGLYNRTITSNFNKNVKMTDLVKEQKRDGIHTVSGWIPPNKKRRGMGSQRNIPSHQEPAQHSQN